jgi:hypothetical protein
MDVSLAQQQADATQVMLDQLWRVLSLGMIDAMVHAVVYGLAFVGAVVIIDRVKQ